MIFFELFYSMYKVTKDVTLLSFNYKLLHRSVMTNKNLNLWDTNKPEILRHTDKCTFCENSVETIEHSLHDCKISDKLWSDIFQWITLVTDLQINFEKHEIMLGMLPQELKIFNVIFMIVKKYLYSCRCLKIKPNKYIAMYKIKEQYNAEKYIVFNSHDNSHSDRMTKWDIILDLFI